MIKKILTSTFLAGILLASENANTQQPEYGIRFGDKPVKENKLKKQKSIKWYLAQILKVQKEQLKVQKQILSILQDQFDPQPREVVINGKKCIANSSANCFVFPITPAAKRIPVLKNMLEKRDSESIKKYLQWQAKYFQEVFKIGNGFQFTIAKYGTEAYPLAYNTLGSETPTGYSVVLKDKMKRYLLNKYADKFELFVIYGINKDADLINFIHIAKLIKEIPNLKVNVVFKDEKELQKFNDMSKIFLDLKNIKNRVKIYVNNNIFSKLKIYTTPTFAMFFNDKKDFEIVGVGAISTSDLINKMIDMLEYKNIIKEKDFAGYKMWQTVGHRAKEYYQQKYDINLDKINKNEKEKR